ncbi:InlB B-repeat-containing protein, partial [Candidatus Saccharibacteria bacterium]|nr:InlB B-repeat-containing protein [Candidatus Saccharibacteria bacterium]
GSAKAADGTTLATGENVHDSVYVANNQRSQIPRSYSNTVGTQYRYIPTNSLTGARSVYSQQTTGSASDSPLPMTTGLMSTTVANSGNAQGYYGNMYVGNYYNWYAATAESGVYSSTSTLTVEGSAKDSICPKGWQLPINGADRSDTDTNFEDKSWFNLIKGSYGLITKTGDQSASGANPFNSSTEPNNRLQEIPLSIILSGNYYWVKGTAGNRGGYGRYWASTPASSTYARALYFYSTYVYPQYGNVKLYGFTVRCVARGMEATTVEEEEVATTCEAGKICYDGNGGTGTMSDQSASANASVMLTAPTYNKLGYAFVGWNTQENGFGTTYQADETITTPSTLNSEGLQLYAKWLPSAGEMQNWSGCSTLGEHQTVALTDNRDGKTYAVRKLKDGNCWMVNNLNLELANFAGTHNLTSDNTDLSTSRTDLVDLGSGKKAWDPSASTVAKYQSGETFSDFTLRVLGQSQPAQFQSEDQTGYWWGSKKSDDGNYTDLDEVTNNANAEIPRSYTYGADGYYNWYAATAESGKYSTAKTYNDSVCPAGWQLPTGSDLNTDKTWAKLLKNTTNGYGLFTTDGTQSATTNPYESATEPSLRMHQAPLSIIYSGFYGWVNGNLDIVGSGGYYWSSTLGDNVYSFSLNFYGNFVNPQTYVNKTYGFAVRCVNRD